MDYGLVEGAEFSCQVALRVSHGTFAVVDIIASATFAPPHILGLIVIRHVPTRIFEQGQSHLCNERMFSGSGCHVVEPKDVKLSVQRCRGSSATDLKREVLDIWAVVMLGHGFCQSREDAGQVVDVLGLTRIDWYRWELRLVDW